MNRLLTLEYYFTTRPDPNFQYTTIVVGTILVLLLMAIGLKVYQKKYSKDVIFKKITKSHPATLFNFSIVLGILLLSRETGIPFLSMRIWWFLLFAGFAYWAIKQFVTFGSKYKAKAIQRASSAKNNKYLPKKKTRRKKK